MTPRELKKKFQLLRNTPLHPQWQPRPKRGESVFLGLKGRVLDIGCGSGSVRRSLPGDSEYIGLDYLKTATEWYRTRPAVYGDGQSIPFADASFDHVLLLHVLEHMPDPDRCIKEVKRVVRVGGRVVIQVPFLYPIHDAPLDFHRWTRYGLDQLAENNGFTVQATQPFGRPTDTAALMSNLALSKLLLDWIDRRSLLLVFGPVIPVLILINNLISWVLSWLSGMDDFMPSSYQTVWMLEAGDG